MPSQRSELPNLYQIPYCPQCKRFGEYTITPAGEHVFSLDTKCPSCGRTMVDTEFVVRYNNERWFFLAFWGIALLLDWGMGGLTQQDSTALRDMIAVTPIAVLASYVIGWILWGLVTSKGIFFTTQELILAEDVRAKPAMLNFSIVRILHEFRYCLVTVVASAIAVAIFVLLRALYGGTG